MSGPAGRMRPPIRLFKDKSGSFRAPWLVTVCRTGEVFAFPSWKAAARLAFASPEQAPDYLPGHEPVWMVAS